MRKRSIDYNYILKIAMIAIAIIILYLIALNGRYERLDKYIVIDKWKKEVIQCGTDELPFKKNGEIIKEK